MRVIDAMLEVVKPGEMVSPREIALDSAGQDRHPSCRRRPRRDDLDGAVPSEGALQADPEGPSTSGSAGDRWPDPAANGHEVGAMN
jgi:hypothetical protein